MDLFKSISAVFWDWDGTLVDSFSFLNSAHNHVRQQFGMGVFSEDEFGVYFGKPREILYRDIYGAENVEEAKEYFETYVTQNHHKILPIDGAERLLDGFHQRGLPMGIVTNKKGRFVQAEIAHHGWEHYFKTVVGAGEAEADKPSSAPLLLALEKSNLMLKTSEILFVGDTENDVLCAHEAGANIAFIHKDKNEQNFAKQHGAELIFSTCDEFADFLLHHG